MSLRVNFVLASNIASSITRVVVEYANHLVKLGSDVHISYPVLSFWDHCAWNAARETKFRRMKFLRCLVRIVRFRWQGSAQHILHPRVKLHRFFVLPSVTCLPDADAIVAMQSYLVPRLLGFSKSKGVVISSVHMDYQQAILDTDVDSRDWWAQMVSIEQQVRVPRFSVSAATKESAEQLDISIDRVIHNGINLEEFQPVSPRRRSDNGRTEGGPVRVMLFCATLPAKGQEFGCEVVKKLRQIYSKQQVFFISVGAVQEKNKELFDENLGYLHGSAYVLAYQQADVFIYPSLRDGFPAPPLEAMACGAALASTRVSGVSEYGVSGTNCFLAEPNDVEGMTENVKRLIEEPQLRAQFREEGFKTAQSFSWQRSARELLDFLQEVTANA